MVYKVISGISRSLSLESEAGEVVGGIVLVVMEDQDAARVLTDVVAGVGDCFSLVEGGGGTWGSEGSDWFLSVVVAEGGGGIGLARSQPLVSSAVAVSLPCSLIVEVPVTLSNT